MSEGPADGGPDAVFLLSTERSGSNLVRSILGTHPAVSAPHPLETAYPWGKVTPPHELSDARARRLLRDVLVNKHYSFHPLDSPIDVDAVFESYRNGRRRHSLFDVQEAMYSVYADGEGTTTWVSKYPALWDCLEDAFSYYDDPRIVYLVRDARDVVLSFKRSNVGRYHPYFTAGRWHEEQRRGVELLETREESVHDLRYEDLLRDPESVVRGVTDFLDLEFDERMLHYYETDEAEAASRSAEALENLTSPIMSDNYGKFREHLPDDEVRITEKVAGDELEHFGYDRAYTDEELSDLELEPDRYEAADRSLARRAALDDWRSSPGEQLRRQTTRSFAGYMVLRYGVFG